MEQQILTTKEAAEYLRCSVSKLRKITAPNVKVAYKETNPIPFRRNGRSIIFIKEELVEYVKGGKVIQMEQTKNELEMLKIPSLLAA